MPYRAVGLWVLVKRKGKWVRLRKAETAEKAKKNAAALNIHVASKEK